MYLLRNGVYSYRKEIVPKEQWKLFSLRVKSLRHGGTKMKSMYLDYLKIILFYLKITDMSPTYMY